MTSVFKIRRSVSVVLSHHSPARYFARPQNFGTQCAGAVAVASRGPTEMGAATGEGEESDPVRADPLINFSSTWGESGSKVYIINCGVMPSWSATIHWAYFKILLFFVTLILWSSLLLSSIWNASIHGAFFNILLYYYNTLLIMGWDWYFATRCGYEIKPLSLSICVPLLLQNSHLGFCYCISFASITKNISSNNMKMKCVCIDVTKYTFFPSHPPPNFMQLWNGSLSSQYQGWWYMLPM